MIDNQFVAIERNGIPDLPKGHIEKGETPEVAAVREVEEETGISDLKIIRELPATWHCYLLSGNWTIKKTSWYLMTTSSGMKNIPQREEGISKVYLINIGGEDFDNFRNNTYASLRSVVESLGTIVVSY
ncbi:MAG: NUDIX domain-containing protein [Bacteroidales bacterium]|nr:NUDIX domain-containing protein [Bacteroidales bacterium]